MLIQTLSDYKDFKKFSNVYISPFMSLLCLIYKTSLDSLNPLLKPLIDSLKNSQNIGFHELLPPLFLKAIHTVHSTNQNACLKLITILLNNVVKDNSSENVIAFSNEQ